MPTVIRVSTRTGREKRHRGIRYKVLVQGEARKQNLTEKRVSRDL